MNVTVLGAGATGSRFGERLAERGHDVERLDISPTHIAKVKDEGLTLDTDGPGRRHVRICAAANLPHGWPRHMRNGSPCC